MSRYQQFIFEDYRFDRETKVLTLHYALDDAVKFTEKYRFNFNFVAYDDAQLDRALQTLFFMAGVSYFKTYVPPEIVIKKGELDAAQAMFFSKMYERGLGEFWYVNKLDPRTPVTFPSNVSELTTLTNAKQGDGMLVAIGGGKDSLVSVELLRSEESDLATWSLDHQAQLEPLIKRIGLPHAWVEREWDTQLLDLNAQGALNGHVPISAIFACVGTVVAILLGKRDVVMSNEYTANEPSLEYRGVQINHQYSKSQEAEKDYQTYLRHTLGETVRYYSFLRPLSEVHIAELFSKVAFEKYRDVFSSCNRAFVHTSDRMSWCGECSKCAFIYMALTPFLPQHDVQSIWGGKNLLLTPELKGTYRKLLGIEGDKPLDCVGDVKESREAMQLAFSKYPELKAKYTFEIPAGYSYLDLSGDEMPSEIRAIFDKVMERF
ncbi:MAG TPA: hypothetical protein VIM53_01320 [Candidatus Saccharimonadales bacterium]